MAQIITYPKGTPKNADYLLGTSTPATNTDDLPVTKNFAVSDVLGLASTSYIKSEKIVVSTDELKTLHTTPKTLIDNPGPNKQIIQVYSIVFNQSGGNLTNDLTFPNDLSIWNNIGAGFTYDIPQATVNNQVGSFFVPSLSGGHTNFGAKLLLTSAGAAAVTGDPNKIFKIWVTYRIFNIAD
jgi:hypothetical protein